MSAASASASIEAAKVLDGDPEYRVLRRLPRPESYVDGGDVDATGRDETRLGFFVDVETTGLDHRLDAIIQFCGVPFEFVPATGAIRRVLPAITGYEDPGRPIPALVVEKTGITDAMVAGQRLDDAAIVETLDRTVLVVAHNAAFDRAFLERRIRRFAERHWACSMADVPWSGYGYDSPKLEFLLYKHARVFYDAHRADEDCYAGIHLLATPFHDGVLPMRLLLETARRPVFRVEATGAPIERKDQLKGRGYRWNPDRRVWWREVTDAERDGELAWLRAEVYARPDANPAITKIDPRRRFAPRD